MRVTDRMLYDMANTNAVAARDKVLTASDQASTGMRVTHPGDDPSSAGLIIKGRTTLSQLDAINQGAARTNDEMGVADSALQQLSDVVARARELSVQMSNDSYSGVERKNAAAEVDTLFRQAVSLMNTAVNGRYIFGGTKDSQPPFDAAGNYSGDTNVRQVEVAPGVAEDASVRADVAVKGVGGGADLFATLTSLSTALTTNDSNGIRGTLDNLDAATHQISNSLAKVGASMDAFQTAQNVSAAIKLNTTASVAHEQEADAFDSSTQLALANHALDATLTAAAASFRMSLLDKL
ncbi:MAG: flagellar hook-associated protein 3 FlgL [Myxococcales bacterium]|jgi:flagellar hook-associated protein 3 FlgL|nr:flagellar hook-associated protein 3 FlgL [Myxococcales bacterium]